MHIEGNLKENLISGINAEGGETKRTIVQFYLGVCSAVTLR